MVNTAFTIIKKQLKYMIESFWWLDFKILERLAKFRLFLNLIQEDMNLLFKMVYMRIIL